ncbi:MAG: ATP-grasp domain-containing protein [Bacteroidia bacterium]|nr:ATP-grasp domain-containing protein [Bacteroidia bacterium]
METDILLFGTMGTIARTVRTSLESHGLRVENADFDQKVFRDEPGYRRELTKLIGEFNPEAVFPVGNPLALSRFKPLMTEGIVAAVENEDKIKLLDHKVPFSCLMSVMGVRQPYIYSSVEEADGHDVIFKRDVSFGGHGVHRPKNTDSLKNLIAHQPQGEPFLIEEYIDGDDFSVDAVRFDGFFKAASYKSIAATGGNGPSTLREAVNFPALESIAKAIMDRVGWHGACGFDFKVDANGVPYILECNPRFTGGIETQISSGFDIPYLIWEHISEF